MPTPTIVMMMMMMTKSMLLPATSAQDMANDQHGYDSRDDHSDHTAYFLLFIDNRQTKLSRYAHEQCC